MATLDDVSFGRMFRTFPVRTGLFTFGPILFGLLQLVNGIANGESVWPFLALFVFAAGFSVVVTRYHLASFRVDRVTGRLDGESESG